MNIYTPDEADAWLEKSDSGIFSINFPDSVKWSAYWDEVHDIGNVRFFHNLDFIHEAISECTFPHMDLLLDDLDLYITSYPSSSHVNASANGRAIALYGRGTQIPKAMTHYIIIHELGHVLDYRFTRQLNQRSNEKWYFYNKYREIRGWDKTIDGHWATESNYPWNKQVTEWFAEDFRYLFGGIFAKQDFWGVSCDKPSEEIREFMLSICE